VTTEVSAPVDAKPSSPWTLWAWLMVAVIIVSIAAGVLGGILAPSVVLDVISLWPLAVGAFFVAAALLPLRKHGPPRVSAVLPLLLITMLGSSVVLHLTGWEQLPSSSGDLIGPRAVGVSDAELTLDLTGRLLITAGERDLYAVRVERRGGSTGVPEALENNFEDGPAFVVLREVDGGRWFQTSGWELSLGIGPAWSLALDSPDLQGDLTGLQLKALTLGGRGSVSLPRPGETDLGCAVDGVFLIRVPAETGVEVTGVAMVPGGWVATTEGYQSPFAGPSILITVMDGAQVKVVVGN
jgi:hypothetical protein